MSVYREFLGLFQTNLDGKSMPEFCLIVFTEVTTKAIVPLSEFIRF